VKIGIQLRLDTHEPVIPDESTQYPDGRIAVIYGALAKTLFVHFVIKRQRAKNVWIRGGLHDFLADDFLDEDGDELARAEPIHAFKDKDIDKPRRRQFHSPREHS